jgi:asparaginyl-tRNA synthetase
LDNLPTVNGKVDTSKDFFGKSAYLTVSGQLEGETYACALGKIYTFGPTFRAENSNTSRHLSEFWMIEPEAAFYELTDNMGLAERYLKFMIRETLDHCAEDMDFFEKRIQPGLLAALQLVLDKPFVHMTYTEAVEVLIKSGKKFDYPVSWGTDLQSEHERFLTEEHVQGPLILYNYPKEIKSFYMRLNDDGKTVAAMDVLVPGVGEIIGGSQREERLDVLISRMEGCGLKQEDYWWYLDLRRFGTVPHAGFGLGLERMVQYTTGMANIRDVIPFPRSPGNCDF